VTLGCLARIPFPLQERRSRDGRLVLAQSVSQGRVRGSRVQRSCNGRSDHHGTYARIPFPL